ncbi:MAG: hypothetical protein K2P88_06970 [Chitinophagaceae bacterium]|nr:hypothetical protein [Chitinophagaceae bacterium]
MLMPNRSYTAGTQFRYGFNGKENDNDVKGTGNQQDYGMRIYDPRIGKFLSVDPLTKTYPWYTPYQFAGNKPVKYIDLDGCEEEDIQQYWENQPKIDMSKAPARGYNAAGYARNGVWAMKQLYAQNPEWFSPKAYNAVFVENRMPVVDEQWIKYNPKVSEYIGQKLQHHHLDGKNFAVIIPKGLHYDKYSQLHAYLKEKVTGTNVKGVLGRLLNIGGNISVFNFTNPDAWINGFSGGEQPEDYVGKLKKDFMNDVYFEVKKVSFEYSIVIENGKQVYNNDGTPKTYISKRIVTGVFYSDYIWDDDTKSYAGVNKIKTQTEVWTYDKDGKRQVSSIDFQ